MEQRIFYLSISSYDLPRNNFAITFSIYVFALLPFTQIKIMKKFQVWKNVKRRNRSNSVRSFSKSAILYNFLSRDVNLLQEPPPPPRENPRGIHLLLVWTPSIDRGRYSFRVRRLMLVKGNGAVSCVVALSPALIDVAWRRAARTTDDRTNGIKAAEVRLDGRQLAI